MNSTAFNRLTLLFAVSVFAVSCAKVTFDQAEKAFNMKQYKVAADMYAKVSASQKIKKETKQLATFKAAESYRMANEYEQARKWYDKVLKKDPKNTEALFMLGVMLEKQGRYREAADQFDKYLAEVPGDPRATRKKLGCELGLRWTEDSSRFKVSELKVANTKQNDYAPMIASKDDKTLFFASDREEGVNKRPYGWTGNWYSDLWMMKLEGKKNNVKWGKPVLVKDVNTKFNDGVTSFDTRYNTMYFTQCNGEDGNTRTCKIYSVTKKGEGWGELTMVDFCKGDSFNYGHPALSEDGTKMYFASDREGGLGGYDIWMVNFVKRGKTWSEPINLGTTINTESDEMYPYVNQHDKKLYFASNGLPGLGGLDMFSAKGTGTEWTEVENLRKPLNSAGDDFGITFDEKNKFHGYFTSNRSDRNKSDDNIWEFRIDPLVFTLSGVVTDCKTGETLKGALISISNDRDSVKLAIKTDQLGAYKVDLSEETSYDLFASFREQYYFDSKNAKQTTKGLKFSANLVQNFCLIDPLKEIQVLPILYDLDKANIRPDAAAILDQFADEVALKYPKLTFELGSHTDCRASYEYNMDLSRRRADSAVAYLVKKGVDARRIIAKGYGESELVNNCKCEGAEVTPCSEEEHQLNRRTTIKFLTKDFDPKVKTINDKDTINRNKGNTNKNALVGGAPVGSTALDSMKNQPPVPATPAYDSATVTKVKITTLDGVKYLASVVLDKENVNWAFDLAGKQTAIPPDVAKAWMESKVISKKDFEDGDKVEFPGGIKFPSNKIKVEKIMIDAWELKDLVITITPKVDKPTLGKSAFKEFKPESFEKDGTLILIPKKVAKKEAAKPQE